METPIKVLKQGAPIVNSASILYDAGFIKVISIDLKSKYCYYSGAFYGEGEGCGVWMAARVGQDETFFSNSRRLAEGIDPEEPTMVALVDFPEWKVLSARSDKYTIDVVIIDNKNTPKP